MKTVIRNSYTPQIGDYCDTVVVDRESGIKYIFDCDGVFTEWSRGKTITSLDDYREKYKDTDVFSTGGTLDAIDHYVGEEAAAREAADEELEQEIEDLRNNPDVVDIVGTYADLQSYDTSDLGDNDIIKVLQDETHDDASTYYKWHKTTSTWEYIGEQGPYYTKDQTDDLLDGKQDILTAGDNITIDADNVISATVPEVDDALSFTSANAVENQAIKNAIYAKRSGNYNQEVGVDIKYDDPYSSPYVAIGGAATGGRGSASVGIGYNSSAAGLGSVAIGDGTTTTDREQVAIGMLTKGGPYSTVVGARSRADTSTGSYNTVIGASCRVDGSSGNVVLVGHSASAANGASYSIAIGYDSDIGTGATNSIAIGNNADVSNYAVGSVVIGESATVSGSGSVVLGEQSSTDANNVVAVGNFYSQRRIVHVADGVNPTDAATKGQLDTAIAGVTVPVMTGATASTAGTQGSAPAPAAGDQNKYLKGDGTWATVQSGQDALIIREWS